MRRPSGRLDKVAQRRPHRHRVGVVAVGDHEAAARHVEPLAAPARELDLARTGPQLVVAGIQPQADAGRDRGGQVEAVVVLVEVHRHREVRPRSAISALPAAMPARRTSAPASSPNVITRARVISHVGLEQRLGVRHDRRPVGAERLQDLGLGLGHRLDRPDELEVDGPDRRDHGDVGAGDLGQIGDLAHPAHGQLADHGLGVGLDPAQRQRQADLGVEVGVARHRPQPPAQDRAQDVLGGRLPGRAGDADHPRARAPPHLGRDLAQGDQRVGHDDAGPRPAADSPGVPATSTAAAPARSASAAKRAPSVRAPGQRDEQVARGDGARVDRDAGDR